MPNLGFIRANVTPSILQRFALAHGEKVQYIEDDGTVTHCNDPVVQQDNPEWGLAHVSSWSARPNRPYFYYQSAGVGVDAYILDTGINVNHQEFGGRAKMAANFVSGESSDDLHGHGTHCAGIIGGVTYGVAKRVNLVGIKVLDKNGSGGFSQIIQGIDFVISAVQGNPNHRTIISMSLGGDQSQAMNDAVAAAIQAGIVVVVAAGNDSKDACQTAPAGSPGAITVGAIASDDSMASFSNFGSCVTILAPGVNIVSASNASNTGTRMMSGTSMAGPFVVGLVSGWLARFDYTGQTPVRNDAVAFSAKNIVKGLKNGTPNASLYNWADPAAMRE